jgi:hypothetical protein
MRKIILFFQIILTLLPVALYAQNTTITGKVRDISGALPGVSVVEKGMPPTVPLPMLTVSSRLRSKGKAV